MADFYGYTLDYCLYRLSFAQALALLDVRNERERKAQEAAEDARNRDDVHHVDTDKYKIDDNTPVEQLPSLDDLRGAFGALLG